MRPMDGMRAQSEGESALAEDFAERQALEVFDRILDAPEDARQEMLDGLEPVLGRRVERLLIRVEADSVLDGDAADQMPSLLAQVSGEAEEPKQALVGRRLGPYRITGQIGQGGMGRVFRAARADGTFERDVAVKVLRWDLEGDLARDRFERERQLLADLSHPQIPQLLDGGVTEEGLPYLVTELVEDALPIDAFCEREALSLEARLRLFRSVCEVVAAAHRRLVVHRDLKPGNILVGPDGTPKLLDFGVARLADEEGDQITRTTSSGLLTPRFAAPEQIEGRAIETTVDVYALGALLFHLLVGHPPHAADDPSVGELLRRVLAEDPPLASRAVREVEGLSRDSPGPEARAGQLSGDLDAILARALERDPNRRYPSVTDLSEDIDNFLQQRPVEARRAGTLYRARKLLRRRWPAFAAATLLLAAIGAGAISTAWQARRADQRAQEAAQEAERANSIVDMLVEVFDGDHLAGGTPLQTAELLLDRSVARAEERLAGELEVLADLQYNLGRAYRHLGLTEDAESVLSRAEDNELRTDEPRRSLLARIRMQRAGTASDGYAWTLAEEHARAGLDYLGDEAADEEGRGLSADLWLNLARAQAATRSGDPLDSLQRGLALSPEIDVETAEFADIVRARVAMEAGDFVAAERHYRAVLERELEGMGGDASEVKASSYNNVAAAVRRQGRFAEAAELYRSALELVERTAGAEHAQAGVVRTNLMAVLVELGRKDEVRALGDRNLALMESLAITERWRLGAAHTVQGVILCGIEECAEGLSHFRQAIAVYEEVLAPGHDWTRAAELRLLTARALVLDGTLGPDVVDRFRNREDPAARLARPQILTILGSMDRRDLVERLEMPAEAEGGTAGGGAVDR